MPTYLASGKRPLADAQVAGEPRLVFHTAKCSTNGTCAAREGADMDAGARRCSRDFPPKQGVTERAAAAVQPDIFFDGVDEALRKVPGFSAVLRLDENGMTKWRLFPNGPVVLVRQVSDTDVKIIRIGLDIPLPKGDRTNLEPMDSTGIEKCAEAIANYLSQTPP